MTHFGYLCQRIRIYDYSLYKEIFAFSNFIKVSESSQKTPLMGIRLVFDIVIPNLCISSQESVLVVVDSSPNVNFV